MKQVRVNPVILNWARKRIAFSCAMLAEKMNVKEDKIRKWEEGGDKPTFTQAKKLAAVTCIPFGYLFLDSIPKEKGLPIPDLRTVDGKNNNEFSIDLIDTIKEIKSRQEWYSDFLRREGYIRNKIVGKASSWKSAIKVADDMRRELKINRGMLRVSWNEYQRKLISNIESIGVLVMKSSIVHNNTHRPLSVNEFRGFALADEFAPVIFINTSDCPEAQLFTLIHELAHIWIGCSGVSDSGVDAHSKGEQLCNAVSAEFLVPEQEFKQKWDADDAWRTNVANLAKLFHVSEWVTARRALMLKYISRKNYQEFTDEKQKAWDIKKKNRSGAPSFHTVKRTRVSSLFAQTVVSEALSGRLLLRDAANLLGIKPNKISEFYKKEFRR